MTNGSAPSPSTAASVQESIISDLIQQDDTIVHASPPPRLLPPTQQWLLATQQPAFMPIVSGRKTPTSFKPTSIEDTASSLLRKLRAIDTRDVRILLLENVNQAAVKLFQDAGYQVEQYAKALDKVTLCEKIATAHVIGIRSKTQLTEEVLQHAKHLLAIGCFCIGTNQVDLDAAAQRGIPVFNSPFSNSRSVAELMIAEIITLARQLGDRNKEMHQGQWNKVSAQCFEVRGKSLGIIGYGHIGTQLSVLAESLGMNVLFYDVLQIMPLGLATPMPTLESLLRAADFVTLHVPETQETKNMMGEKELSWMKRGSYLLNASRGTVVDLAALTAALKNGHLAGAAIDVYPEEPASNGHDLFHSTLRQLNNVILTPHIGGSTEEAQLAIGNEVANNLLRYLTAGSTLNAVNFPQIDLRVNANADNKASARLLFIHRNVPGVLRQVNQVLSDYNVEKQICDSKGNMAYLIADITLNGQTEQAAASAVHHAISMIPENVFTRVLLG